jgi:hypothetical protein
MISCCSCLVSRGIKGSSFTLESYLRAGRAVSAVRSSTYLSAASRTTQANDTLFCFASFSSVSYRSGGKVIVARTDAAPASVLMFLAALVFRFML